MTTGPSGGEAQKAAPTAESTPPVSFAAASAARGGGDGFGGGHAGGLLISDAERDAALRLEPAALSDLPCGFMRPSVCDGVAKVGSTHAASCELVVLTSIFDAFDELIQPAESAMRTASP